MSKLLEIWRVFNLPCRDMTALLSKSMDTSLPVWERAAVGFHMTYCRACRRFKKQMGMLQERLRQVADEIAAGGAGAELPGLSAEARKRIERSLRESR